MAEHEGVVHTDAAMQNVGEFRISNLINAKVQDSAGNRLGHIQDFVVDPNSGKIQFAVLKLNGDLARGGDYTPVPWPLVASANANLNKSGEPKNLVLNVDRNKLASAQKFNVNRWPDASHPVWGQDVYTYYGVPWDNAAAGAIGSGSVSSGTTTYYYQSQEKPNPRDRQSNYDKPIDNGTAPDGKDVFKFSPRPWPNSEYRHE
jgi:sporulation protein YlmC with PRC-barrel domain